MYRDLAFIVEDQELSKDPSCDFSGLVPGSSGYLRVVFVFHGLWDTLAKAAVFSTNGVESAMPITNDSCVIPDSVLKEKSFSIRLVGKNSQQMLQTNRLVVNQLG